MILHHSVPYPSQTLPCTGLIQIDSIFVKFPFSPAVALHIFMLWNESPVGTKHSLSQFAVFSLLVYVMPITVFPFRIPVRILAWPGLNPGQRNVSAKSQFKNGNNDLCYASVQLCILFIFSLSIRLLLL